MLRQIILAHRLRPLEALALYLTAALFGAIWVVTP